MNLLAFDHTAKISHISLDFAVSKISSSRVRLLVLLLYFLTFEIFPLIYLLLTSVQCIIIIFARGESFAVMEGEGK